MEYLTNSTIASLKTGDDCVKAMRYFALAAKQGMPLALYVLGNTFYREGVAVGRVSVPQMYKYLNLARARGSKHASFQLKNINSALEVGAILDLETLLAERITLAPTRPDDNNEHEQLVYKAELGDPTAQFDLHAGTKEKMISTTPPFISASPQSKASLRESINSPDVMLTRLGSWLALSWRTSLLGVQVLRGISQPSTALDSYMRK